MGKPARAARLLTSTTIGEGMVRRLTTPSQLKPRHGRRFLKRTGWLLAALVLLCSGRGLRAQRDSNEIEDITGKYHFLSPDDTLAILDEEGKLKGYIDVYQSEEESDAILSYDIVQGTRTNAHVEFTTRKIHRKYYRFSGTVERGKGRGEGDSDYLRLVGDLEIITVKGDSGEEAVHKMQVIFKSLGKGERERD
jgi:hypothetical protein